MLEEWVDFIGWWNWISMQEIGFDGLQLMGLSSIILMILIDKKLIKMNENRK